jgi:hypothetical protein
VVFADVVPGGGAAVFGAGRAAGPGLTGFWRAGGAGRHRAEAAKSAADPGRGEPARRGGTFPGAAQVGGQRPGEPELGVDGDDQPGPAVSGGGVANFGGGPAEDLLEQPEGMLKIKSAQERLPQQVYLSGGQAGG